MMTRHALSLAAAIGLALLAPIAVAQGAPPAALIAPMTAEAQEAAKIVDAFHAALGRNDPAGGLALLADDALIYESGYAERSKAEYASHHAGADAAYASALPSVLARRSGTATGEIAWIASETSTKGRYKDKAVNRVTMESMVLRKTADGWRIVHIHWSSRAVS